MPDNWSFVIAAYGLAVVVLAGYWNTLRRRERDLRALDDRRRQRPAAGSPSAATRSDVSRGAGR